MKKTLRTIIVFAAMTVFLAAIATANPFNDGWNNKKNRDLGCPKGQAMVHTSLHPEGFCDYVGSSKKKTTVANTEITPTQPTPEPVPEVKKCKHKHHKFHKIRCSWSDVKNGKCNGKN